MLQDLWRSADVETPERRLAAILFTDLVGSTALMARSEEAGLRASARRASTNATNCRTRGVKRLLAIAMAVACFGCVTPLPQDADYGEPPHTWPKNWHLSVEEQAARHMKDPESARFEWSHIPPIKGGNPAGYPRSFGYVVCVDINAKNSFGGYTGYSKY